MKKFRQWFDCNLGWFFVNGRKQELWKEHLESIYPDLFCTQYHTMKKDKKKKESASLCEEAHKIVNERNEEKERMYGPFSEGMERAAMIFNGLTGHNLKAEDMYKALIALKFSRESYNHKRDNLLDAIAYIQALENYINTKNQ
jgi:hypothetical protein